MSVLHKLDLATMLSDASHNWGARCIGVKLDDHPNAIPLTIEIIEGNMPSEFPCERISFALKFVQIDIRLYTIKALFCQLLEI